MLAVAMGTEGDGAGDLHATCLVIGVSFLCCVGFRLSISVFILNRSL